MCDASDYAVGVVLGQRKGRMFHTIYYASKVLNDAQINYATTEKELLAIIYALEKFRSYLVGSKIVIYTDHASIKWRPWFADMANFKAAGVIPKYLNWQQRKKFFHDARYYIWDDPHLFKVGADNLLRRCVTRNEYILVAIATSRNDAKTVVKFIKKNIFARFGVPRILIVMVVRIFVILNFKSKLKSKWYGPFVIKKVRSYGAIKLYDPQSQNPNRIWVVNGQRLKLYHGRNILPERKVELYHTEFDDFKIELERRNLHKRLTNLVDGSIDVALVKEFYANLYSSEGPSPKQAKVRGHLVKIDAEGETLPTYFWS
ncbi:uncharacterized protein LOC114386124 [Glycine soja]|uniref:uncharacterized protein LOC114386124 n=1 Tax=Glycine soja TaxID=3848 RepID=UPI00103F22CA|nr:uncharacterized protein LOC114386124 [Glycine soja]